MSYVQPDDLFKYADRFARRSERAGKGTEYPTLRQCARRFKCSHEDIVLSVEDGPSHAGYLGIVAGVRAHDGIAEYEGLDRQVEAYA